MESTELKDNVEIQNWFSRIKASGNTKQSYLQALKAFTEMAGKAPEQLILEAEAEVRGGKLMRERTIWIYLPKFRESLEAQELAPLTIKVHVHRPPGVTLNETPEEFHISIGLR